MAWKDVFSYVRAVAANKGVTKGETRAEQLAAFYGDAIAFRQVELRQIAR